MQYPLLVAINEAKKSYDKYCETENQQDAPVPRFLMKASRSRRMTRGPRTLDEKIVQHVTGGDP